MPKVSSYTPEMSVPDLNDLLYAVDTTGPVSEKLTLRRLLGLLPFFCPGRLTLESGVPVSTTDQIGKSTLYFTPVNGHFLKFHDGTRWEALEFPSEISLDLTGVTTDNVYDVWLRNNAGTPTMDLSTQWTNATTRAQGLGLQNGVVVKGGDPTRLHIGTIVGKGTGTTQMRFGGTTTQVGGSLGVWNRYNQVLFGLSVIDTAVSWAYTTNTWRVANGVAAPLNSCELVIGDASQRIRATLVSTAGLNTNVNFSAKVAIGLDSTTPVGRWNGGFQTAAVGSYAPLTADYSGAPGLGWHWIIWLEKGADGACAFIGDGDTDNFQSGLSVVLAA